MTYCCRGVTCPYGNTSKRVLGGGRPLLGICHLRVTWSRCHSRQWPRGIVIALPINRRRVYRARVLCTLRTPCMRRVLYVCYYTHIICLYTRARTIYLPARSPSRRLHTTYREVDKRNTRARTSTRRIRFASHLPARAFRTRSRTAAAAVRPRARGVRFLIRAFPAGTPHARP